MTLAPTNHWHHGNPFLLPATRRAFFLFAAYRMAVVVREKVLRDNRLARQAQIAQVEERNQCESQEPSLLCLFV
jgi:hypothetical protein